MEVLIWLLYLMIGGSTAFLCDEMSCNASPLEELARLNFKPNETELLRLCPPTLDFFNCLFKGAEDCFGMNVEEIAESDDAIASTIAKSLLKARSLAVEMCDEDSPLRRDYLENVECFDRLVAKANEIDDCTDKGETYADAFLRQWHHLKEENVDWSEKRCLEQAYGYACFVEKLDITCGEVARRTLLTILKKAKHALFTECEIENPLGLKRAFLDYLELGEKTSELYWYIFETFKRR
ncbi:hypothetical protein AVEN_75576-1 [Araneus ventricosus]|uniref:DUF19 domain-containing protein n=1 Tax=Araneus ventricosus TaxID=182803 RepID=A0A4Y2CL16_ARAVE|nr:hypothetical protein AVEN_75576-1 [Araneus ventricosus]